MITFGEQGIKDLGKLIDDITYFGASLFDQRDPLNKIKDYQAKEWEKNYFGLGKKYGAWAPLLRITHVMRRRQGVPPGTQMMYRTGTMLGWIKQESAAGVVAAQSVTWEFTASGSHTDGSYAAFHDEGFIHHWNQYPVPARVIWDVNEEDVERIEKEFDRWADRLIQKYFGA